MEKYMAIMGHIEALISSSKIQEGSKLPSIRQLANVYSCSKGTVIKALEKLSERHLVYSVAKSGYYVVRKQPIGTTENNYKRDFTNNSPNWRYFPYSDFQHCLNQAIETQHRNLFEYGTARGLGTLISESKKLLEQYQVFCKEEQLVITSGVQQALMILCQMPLPNEKRRILIEEPTYHLLIDTVRTLNLPVITIERGIEGLDLNHLENLFQTGDIKFFYIMPRIHNPLGLSISEDQKKKIVHLAQKYSVYLVEDDYMADFETDSRVNPLHYYDVNGCVIYLKSFSKIMFPGLRVGLAVLPESLVNTFSNYKRLFDLDSSMFSQGALEIYIKSGMFSRHSQMIKAIYTEKGETFSRVIAQLKMEALLTNKEIKGAKTFLTLPANTNRIRLIEALKKQGITVEGLEKHYYHPNVNDRRLKIDLTNIHLEDISDIGLIIKGLL